MKIEAAILDTLRGSFSLPRCSVPSFGLRGKYDEKHERSVCSRRDPPYQPCARLGHHILGTANSMKHLNNRDHISGTCSTWRSTRLTGTTYFYLPTMSVVPSSAYLALASRARRACRRWLTSRLSFLQFPRHTFSSAFKVDAFASSPWTAEIWENI